MIFGLLIFGLLIFGLLIFRLLLLRLLTMRRLTGHDVLKVFVLIDGLEADQVHATFSAEVSCVEPIPNGVDQIGVFPGKIIIVISVSFDPRSR